MTIPYVSPPRITQGDGSLVLLSRPFPGRATINSFADLTSPSSRTPRRPMSTSSSFASLSQRLTTTSTLLLERSRILSLSLPPSASSQTLIVRNLTSIRADLAQLSDQLALESSGLVIGGRKRGKGAEGELAKTVREMEGRYDRLLDMFGEDEVGREKARKLRREDKRSVYGLTGEGVGVDACRPPSPVPVTPRSEEVKSPRLEPFFIGPTTPKGDEPFRDTPDEGAGRVRAQGTGEAEDDRMPHEMLSEQQLMMDGEIPPRADRLLT